MILPPICFLQLQLPYYLKQKLQRYIWHFYNKQQSSDLSAGLLKEDALQKGVSEPIEKLDTQTSFLTKVKEVHLIYLILIFQVLGGLDTRYHILQVMCNLFL